MASGFSLKDQLFNGEKIRYLAGLFDAVTPHFDAAAFEADVMARLTDLELKERIAWIADCLGCHLPGDLPDIAPGLLAALPPPLDPGKTDDDFGDFIFAPLGELVAARGLENHPDLSLELLAEITKRFSMEWAIRPFLNAWPEKTLARMEHWARADNYHLRRLVSEGTRPRLPWGQGITLELTDPLPLLDVLHADPTRYVTRSVANHVNDISKKDPGLAMDRLEHWRTLGRQTEKELGWICAQALRGLIKAGDPRAMAMLGYDPEADIGVKAFAVPAEVTIGETLRFSARLLAPADTGALVDYVLWRRRADGSLGAKVFKLKQVQLLAGQPIEIAKTVPLKSNATTYRLYPGIHRLELQINGTVRAQAEFTLTKS